MKGHQHKKEYSNTPLPPNKGAEMQITRTVTYYWAFWPPNFEFQAFSK
jgi:hypothetical protein